MPQGSSAVRPTNDLYLYLYNDGWRHLILQTSINFKFLCLHCDLKTIYFQWRSPFLFLSSYNPFPVFYQQHATHCTVSHPARPQYECPSVVRPFHFILTVASGLGRQTNVVDIYFSTFYCFRICYFLSFSALFLTYLFSGGIEGTLAYNE